MITAVTDPKTGQVIKYAYDCRYCTYSATWHTKTNAEQDRRFHLRYSHHGQHS